MGKMLIFVVIDNTNNNHSRMNKDLYEAPMVQVTLLNLERGVMLTASQEKKYRALEVEDAEEIDGEW